MSNENFITMRRLGKNKEVFIIPSFSIDNPDCDAIVMIIDDYQNIINELSNYLRDII